MRVLVTTAGSDGDVRPMFALARELRARGHEVLVAAPDLYAKSAAELQLPFRAIGPHWVEAEASEIFVRCLAESNPVKQLAIMMDAIAPAQREMVPELMELVPQYDVVVYPMILIAVPAVARARQVPHVSVQYIPLHRGSDHGPTGHDFGAFLNGLLWSLGSWVLRRATDAALNTIVAAAGLPPWRNVLGEASVSTLLDLVAVSPTIAPRDSAWAESRHVCGYLFLDDPRFAPDPALAAWVESEPPVVIGFGSMMGFDAAAVTRTILEAVRDLPRKVVLQSGWAGLGGVELPPNVHLAKFVPHSWLFPRAACVVHHGGAGTTAAAFRAGIPQTIVWHLADQPSWARRAKARGVSPGSVISKKLSARWLREQIERMLADTAMQATARQIGEAVRKENGVATAADLIERAIGGGGAKEPARRVGSAA
jgi:sterol 3beta-glucosyltransferase